MTEIEAATVVWHQGDRESSDARDIVPDGVYMHSIRCAVIVCHEFLSLINVYTDISVAKGVPFNTYFCLLIN